MSSENLHSNVVRDEGPDLLKEKPSEPRTEPRGQIESTESLDDWTTDPTNPTNWSPLRKWTIVMLLWLAITITSLSTAFEPALPAILESFGTNSSSLAAFSISVYTIGYCVGPLLIAPASEIYGRVVVLYPSLILCLASFAVCGASTEIVVFIVFRGVMGCAAIGIFIVGRAVTADILPKQRQGVAVSLMTSGLALGPTIGPVIGGYIATSIGWRWIFWILIAALGVNMLGFLPILRETYLPVLQWRRDTDRRSSLFAIPAGLTQKPSEVFLNACLRPLRFVFRTRLVPLFTLYMSLVNSYVLILLATLGTTFESEYGFSQSAAGLAYIGLLIGFILSQISVGIYADILIARRADPLPEQRLPPLILGSVLLPGALLMYGWSIEAQAHWIIPLVGSALVSFGAMYSIIPVQIYVVDVYTLHSASATAAMIIIRSAIGSIVPLGAGPLFEWLGYGRGFTLLAGLAIPFVGMAVWLVRKGERIRQLDKEVK